MERTTLGATGLTVSVMGLGCGGHSRLGLARGRTDAEAAEVVRAAIGLGVDFIDTAEMYGTESAVGLGIAGTARESLVISTKAAVEWQGRRCTAGELRARLEASLGRLGTDYVDVYHLHGVAPDEYDYACHELVPEMLALQAAGKIRFLGITETFIGDPGHRMLARAVESGVWQVMMVGFSLLNPSARERVLPTTLVRGIGTLDMFAVRRALSQPAALRELTSQLIERGEVDAGTVDASDPLGWIVRDGHAGSIPEAAYRFCRHEPGMDVTLSGTGEVGHLRENARSICGAPLGAGAQERLARIFGRVTTATGN